MSYWHIDDRQSSVHKQDPQEGETEAGLRDESGKNSEQLGRKVCRLLREAVTARAPCTYYCNL